MRAIAVTLVIADHLRLLQRLPGAPEGGFVGVDIFFVISGFLITGGLLREVERHGRISFRDFYRRRVRRIVPMAALVIVVAVAASYLVFWPSRAHGSLTDGLWSLLFVLNIHLAAEGTDYFADTAPSAFQHYWSLSVEEQFYILWPLLIAIVASAARARRAHVRRALVITMCVAAVVSFVWACLDTAAQPASAYFSTLGRGFEFALGALVAAAAKSLSRLPAGARTALAAVGLTGIAACVLVMGPATAFPGPTALFPAGFAALFIAAGTGARTPPRLGPLATRPVSYLGDVSYSLYLWHWPVIVLLSAVLNPNTVTFVVAASAVTLVLSLASYRFVEVPILRSGWLRARSAAEAPSAGAVATTARARRRRIAASIAAMTGAIVVATGASASAVAFGQARAPQPAAAYLPTVDPLIEADVAELQREIVRSLDAADPSGLPAEDKLPSAEPGGLPDECWNDADETRDHCTLGPRDAEHTVAILGDSIAMNWAEGLPAALAAAGWNVRVYAKITCTYADVPVLAPDGGAYPECDEFRRWARDEINADPPDVVILASALKREIPGVAADDLAAAWEQGVRRTIDALAVDDVLLLTPPPEGRPPASCASRFASASLCSSAITELWVEQVAATRAAAGQHRVVDVSPWFCATDGRCPAWVGGVSVRRDTRHISAPFIQRLAPLVAELVTSGRPDAD